MEEKDQWVRGNGCWIKQEWIDEAIYSGEGERGIDEPLQATWLDAVPFDADGNPTGEVNEWIIHRGSYVVATLGTDDEVSERYADLVLDELQGRIGE